LLRVFDNVSDDAGQLDLRVEVKSSMLPDASRLGAILGEVARQIAPQISAINGIDQKTLLAILREGFNKATG
jgi:hypothetical protein